jgi:hypothetical protein
MHRKAKGLAGSLLLGLLIACGGGEEAAQQAQEEARAAEWAELEATKASLEEKRQQVAELEAQIDAGPQEGTEETAEVTEEDVEALQAQLQQIEDEIDADAQAFYESLVEFVNSAEIAVGEEMPERVKQAIRLKSHEDILVAREYIEKGGDYARAIEIYQTALQVDPDNPELQEALAWAQENRWMTEERFAQAKKGMSRDEVREVLGQPNLRNIRPYPEKKRLAWFYPKGPDRSAAGVFFQEKGDDYTVYLTDFDAVKPAGAEEEEGGSAGS